MQIEKRNIKGVEGNERIDRTFYPYCMFWGHVASDIFAGKWPAYDVLEDFLFVDFWCQCKILKDRVDGN